MVGYDNFSTGQRRFLEEASRCGRFTMVEGDTLDLRRLTGALDGCDLVFHLAANADVRFGTDHPGKDLQQNTIATFNVLEAMRAGGVSRIAFSSTGSVYGEPAVFPTPESAPFPIQTSLYGASKLAGEGLIHAYCEGFGFEGYIFRFVSILGERYSHGHVFDFYRSLRADPNRLTVLGNGRQRKSYLYVQDCIDAMLLALDACRREGECLQSRHRRVLRGERLDRLDHGPPWPGAAVALHRRRAGVDRRQPVHLPRLRRRSGRSAGRRRCRSARA